MIFYLGVVFYVLTIARGEDINELLSNITNARSAKQQNLPVTLNLQDVIIGINIFKMQKGEILKIRPVFDKKYEIFSTNKTNQFDSCESGNCKENSKNIFNSNDVGEESDSEEQKEEADINLVLGKTINWFSAPGLATIKDESSPSYWKYADQSQWPTNFPNCGGTSQSPIDIPASVPTLTSSSCLKWVNYHSAHRFLTLNNNGHTVDASSTWASGGLPFLSGGILTGTYRLYGIHWHWGRDDNDGSEHSFQSRKYPLEMHLVHYNIQYASLDAALASGNPEALTVVGVLFKASLFSNPGMTVITRAMRMAVAQGPQDTVLPLADLGLNFGDGYYTYLGSLTSPPCNQAVRWIVLKRILHIRSTQLKVFRSILVNGKPLVDIYRRVQALNGRPIQYVERCNG